MKYFDCYSCRLYIQCAKIIPGAGPIPCDLMFVGEAPGKDEDRVGVPFVGVSGRCLRSSLEQLNIKIYYLANVLRCRPPENRDPTIEEMRSCSRFLEYELSIVKPRVIVPLGNIALRYFLGRTGIGVVQGIPVTIKANKLPYRMTEYLSDDTQWKIVPCYHPAHICYDPSKGGDFMKALHRAGSIATDNYVRRETPDPHLVRTLLDVENFKAIISPQFSTHPLYLDFETTGFDPYDSNIQILSVAVFDPYVMQRPWFISFSHPEWQSPLNFKDFAQWVSVRKVVCHHAGFDILWLLARCNVRPKEIECTYIQTHLHDENSQKSLHALSYEFQLGGYKEDVNVADLINTPIDKVAEYNSDDTYMLPMLSHKYAYLKAAPVHDIVMRAIGMFADYRHRGVQVYTERAIEMQNNYEEQIRYHTNKIQMILKRPLNPNGKDVAPWVWSHDCIPDWVREKHIARAKKKGSTSVGADKDVLLDMERFLPEDASAVVKHIRAVRTAKTVLGTVVRPIATRNDWAWYSDGLLRPEITLATAVTGRTSMKAPAFHGWARPGTLKRFGLSNIRQLVISRWGNAGIIMCCDVKNAELRVLCSLSGDEVMAEGFRSGYDFHSLVASKLFSIPLEQVTKEQRAIAKTVNFGIPYGQSPWGLYEDSKNPIETVEEAERYINLHFLEFPQTKTFIDKIYAAIERDKVAINPWGRVRHLPEITSKNFKVVAAAKRQGFNHLIQSGSSDAVIWNQLYLEELIQDAGLQDWILPIIPRHDEIILDVHIKYVDIASKLTMQAMSRAPDWVTVPWDVDISCGPSWGEQGDLTTYTYS